MSMWMYPASDCPDRCFSSLLDSAKINAQIRGIVHGADQDPGPSSVPLREGVISP
jgi:hypothetical protein